MSDYVAEEAYAAVARGARWLDEKCPNWFREIKLDRLDLGSPTFCVLGQTARCLLGKKPNGRAMYRGYDAVLGNVPGSDRWNSWPANHGFTAPYSWPDDNAPFEMLTIAWREYIRTRLEADQ